MLGRMVSAVAIAALAGGAVYAQADMDAAPEASMTTDASAPILALDAAKVTTKDEAKTFGEIEFLIADADESGKLSIEEYVAYTAARIEARAAAEAELAAADAALTIDVAADGAEPLVTDEMTADMAMDAQSIDPAIVADAAAIEADDAAIIDAETGIDTEITIAEDAVIADESAAPTIDAESLFAKIANGKDEIDQKKFVKARVASFEDADANGDDLLDEIEQASFVEIVWGPSQS